ncbi:flagellar cap protein [Arsukibacterium sp. MJ3]|uniref:flagellar filament capping protein FliD n=1 Tax=Arsukibacterium sp. MJ3 TaxID=1632859 RepID=UPI00062746F6|nr:flagellar filament capping protein FliD [Arsukibacterium sp. MJ3]KKO48166.1 flagellar cap protein [Arsukibacterium sp. MJ3]
MSNINFLGAASGLPLEELVSTLVRVERDTKFARIDKTKATLDASLSGMGRLKSALSAFQDATKKLEGDSLKARSVTITQPMADKTFIEASANSTAAASSFEVKVNQLARGSRLESADLAYGSSDDVISTTDGTLSFTAGDKSFDIDVTAGMTLNELRLKINESANNFGVNANIINAGGAVGTKLVLSSAISGQGNDLVISNNNAELDAISTVASGVSAGLSSVQAAQDAIIEVDGIVASSSSNTFNNVIQDVTITVLAETPAGNNAKLDISTDKKAAEDNIKAFINSYNSLVDQVGSLTRKRSLGSDGTSVTGGGGALNGDALPRSIMSQLRGLLGNAIAGGDEQMNTLYSLGITFNKGGKLEISTSTEFSTETGQQRFDKALSENYDAVAKMFGGENGLASSLDSFMQGFNQSGGIIAGKESSLRTQLTKNTKDSEAASRYITSFEESLRKRYTALDGLLAQMQRTQTSVTAALSGLPGFGTNKSR